MRYFCTYFDQNYLTRGLALYHSLAAHVKDFEMLVLCMDEPTETALRRKSLPQVRLIPVAELTAAHPRLAAAQRDRSKLEFYFTCAAWVLLHRLSTLPKNELVTYLDADLYFFGSPEKIYAEIGSASVAVTPHRFPPSLSHLERYGKFNAGWVSLRHDATGLACATDWAAKCAEWCRDVHQPDRYANQKYMDAWQGQFPDMVQISQLGANVAPWNVKQGSVATESGRVFLNQQPLIFYHFHSLTHLGEQLYDPYLDRYDAELTLELRTQVYLPYLNALHRNDPDAIFAPDLVPLSRPDDPRAGRAIKHLLGRLQESELDRAKRLEAVENTLAANEQTLRYLREVEVDSANRLASIKTYQEKLETCYADLARNVKYVKLLEDEIAAHIKVSADKDAIIAELASRNGKAGLPHP